MGGDGVLAKAILRTRLGRHIEDYDFWSTVVLFLVNNAMMDPGAVGPIVDYIHHMKFAPTRVVREEGGAVDVEDRVVTQARGRYNARNVHRSSYKYWRGRSHALKAGIVGTMHPWKDFLGA